LTSQHVSNDIIARHQELLNCNYGFWFYSRLSLPAAVMAAAGNDKRNTETCSQKTNVFVLC